jgi:hypothetical protein
VNAPTKLTPGLSSALVTALAEIEGAAKDKVNPHFKSKYADIGSVIDAIKPVLAKHDLGFTQHPRPSEGGVCIETVLHHKGGEQMSLGELFVPANRNDAQGFGSALTYCRRYALMTAFGVPAEDDDGNAAAKATAANPSTGEAPPEKRVPLDGPYKSKTALWTAVRSFVHSVNGIGDLGELLGYLETPEVKELLAQCERDAPGLLRDGLPDVPDYVPIEIVVDQRRRDLEQIEDINRQPNPIMAG